MNASARNTFARLPWLTALAEAPLRRFSTTARRFRPIDQTKLDEQLPFLGALLKREQDLQAFGEAFSGGKRSRA